MVIALCFLEKVSIVFEHNGQASLRQLVCRQFDQRDANQEHFGSQS